MTDWYAQIASARADYRDQLEQRGFSHGGVSDGDVLDGSVVTANGVEPVRIGLGLSFPYAPPTVVPMRPDFPVSWHTDVTGTMCLYTDDDRNAAPWTDVDAFLEHVAAWFDHAAEGWPDDAPVLDADRYVHAHPSNALFVYDDLTPYVNRYVRLNQGAHTITIVKVVKLRGPGSSSDTRPIAAVRDVGELAAPIRRWVDLRALLPDGDELERAIVEQQISAVLVRYARNGRTAALPLHVAAGQGKVRITSAYASASNDPTVRAYRSGLARAELADKRVLIVGAGAIGSFLADLLARDGVGHLGFRDSQRLTPGNVIRHLCGRADIGMFKAEAVAARLKADYGASTETDTDHLLTPKDAWGAINNYDLVIDATANGTVTGMLHGAAQAADRHMLSVCIQNEGDTARVDILPTLAGDPLPKTLLVPRTHEDFYEEACGEPISPTPPHAVVQAAALAARHAVGLLTNQPVHPAGEIVDYGTATEAGIPGDS